VHAVVLKNGAPLPSQYQTLHGAQRFNAVVSHLLVAELREQGFVKPVSQPPACCRFERSREKADEEQSADI
jgi:hypothetical protein